MVLNPYASHMLQIFLLREAINVIGKKEYAEEFKSVYDHLRDDSKQPKVSDLRIIGVIVTGSPS
jgi:hypothetical protein